MPRRIFVNTFHVSAAELQSFLVSAKGALRDAPPAEGFAFALFGNADVGRRFFCEVFVMPDPEIDGQDSAIEAYHFSSSYQPERSTCVEVGGHTNTFRGRVVTGSDAPPIEGNVVRFTQLWAEAEERDALVDALKTLAAEGTRRVRIMPLDSTEYPKLFGLLELFAHPSQVQEADAADRAGSEELKAARALIGERTLRRDELPETFLRMR